MPLDRQKFVSKFGRVITLTQYQISIHGGFEYLTLNLGKGATPDALTFAALSFPPIEGDHASRYGLLISLFWVCALPEGTALGDHINKCTDTFKKTGEYSEQFGDVRISLTMIGGMYLLRAENVIPE